MCDLAWVCERSEKLASHHLRQLRFAGLVRFRRDGKRVIYSLTESGVNLVAAVAAAPAAAPAAAASP